MIEIVHASKWWREGKLDQLAPYMTDIMLQMARLARKYPKDCSTAGFFDDFYMSRRELWLILEDGKFLATAMSKIDTVNATGVKRATLLDLVGSRVTDYAGQLCEALETWAGENGVTPDNCQVLGRIGWKPLLEKHGYSPHLVHFRKR